MSSIARSRCRPDRGLLQAHAQERQKRLAYRKLDGVLSGPHGQPLRVQVFAAAGDDRCRLCERGRSEIPALNLLAGPRFPDQRRCSHVEGALGPPARTSSTPAWLEHAQACRQFAGERLARLRHAVVLSLQFFDLLAQTPREHPAEHLAEYDAEQKLKKGLHLNTARTTPKSLLKLC